MISFQRWTGPPIDHQRSRAASFAVAVTVTAARSAAFGSSISA
jgi:hypothetical protein